MVAKNNFKLIFSNFWLNMLKHAQYKTSFILNILLMIINNAFFIIQWVIIFEITPTIGGYGFNDLLLLWGLSAGGFGLATMFFNGARSIPNMVYMGKLDVFLTQPKNVLINVCTSSTSTSGIGDFLYFFIVLIIINAKLSVWLMSLPLLIISALITTSMFIIFSTLSFYVKRGDALNSAFTSAFITFSTYPPTIFSVSIKILLFTLIPVGFAVFIPYELLTAFSFGNLAILLAVVVFLVALAFILFYKGLKRYSSGNLLSARL